VHFLGVGVSGLFTSESWFGVIMSTSIESVCDNTSNRFLDINSFLYLKGFLGWRVWL